jgi:hypothetical protein
MACSRSRPTPPSPERSSELAAALALVDSALTLMRQHSINGSLVNWTAVRTIAHERVFRSQEPPGAPPVLLSATPCQR